MGLLFNLVLLAGLFFITGGCASPASAPNQSHTNKFAPPRPTPSPTDKRFIIAPELENIIHVVNVRLNHPEGSYLEIQVTVENMTAVRQQFNYHIEWFDADGTSLTPDNLEFLPWMLLPREVASIAVKAPLPTAADFGIAFVPAVQ
jgi:hypothetical protein